MKVLLVSHAFSPGRGSEPGLGWNWAWYLSREHEIWALAHPEFRADVESWLIRRPNPNLHIVWLKATDWDPTKGQAGVAWHYLRWLKYAEQVGPDPARRAQLRPRPPRQPEHDQRAGRMVEAGHPVRVGAGRRRPGVSDGAPRALRRGALARMGPGASPPRAAALSGVPRVRGEERGRPGDQPRDGAFPPVGGCPPRPAVLGQRRGGRGAARAPRAAARRRRWFESCGRAGS